jgi:hypothetical protein
MKRIIFICLLCGCASLGYAQNKPGMELPIKKARAPITLDGVLDEEDWQVAAVAKDFFMNYPVDSMKATFQTEARLTFDDQNLYISFVCYDDDTPDIVQSLRRDFDFDNNDNMAVILGPFNDGLNGFYFLITPRGVQGEGLIAAGGASEDDYNGTWDNKWYSKVVKHADRWIAEIAIPFKSFRYKSGEREWNITFMRWDRKRNGVSSWIATPIQYIPASFAYAGKLVWVDNPPASQTNISIIPYVAGVNSVDKETNPTTSNHNLEVGFDAKIGITPSLNLDLTVNPDFSQVEVDRQVINLTRFEFRFPERRQFFLENNDLFERAGFPDARPFFTRRVGLVRDTSDQIQQVPILYGARLSGSINKNWRISTLNMLTKEKQSLGLPQQMYSVAVVQRNFWKQSNFALMFVDKQSLGIGRNDSLRYFHADLWKEKVRGNDTAWVLNQFNRVLTADLDLLSADNKWYSSFYYSRSFDNHLNGKKDTGGAFIRYRKRNVEIMAGQTFVQENHNAEAGFVPARGVYPGQWNTFLSATGSQYPESKVIARMGPFMNVNFSGIPQGSVTDKGFNAGYGFDFLNTASLYVSYENTYQQLTHTFNPIDSDRYTNFQKGETYTWGNVSLSYQSDQRKLFNYWAQVSYGGFYNGELFSVSGLLNYRYQPVGSISVQYDYNVIDLPENYGAEKLVLVGPRFDITFTDKLFLTTFVQYNNLEDNVNLNARFQWRYQPASDFFIVYTENYFPEHLKSKNRALVFKLTYWMNL